MQKFDEIDPQKISNNPNVVGRLVDSGNSHRTYYLLVDGTYAIIASIKLHTYPSTGDTEWLVHQLEIPKAGIPWIIETLENKFLKLSYEGGLPADVRHYEETIEGEELGISRAMGLGTSEKKESGYTLITHSRKGVGSSLGKEMSFTDSFLFEHGFFDLLKSIAHKIESGKL